MEMKLRYLGIIPARYASTRFPGKPLVELAGKPVVQWVYEKASAVLDEVVVATDDERIVACVAEFGGKAVMTSVNHRSGTDRCFEALQKVASHFDVVVNIQGDEPFITKQQILSLMADFSDAKTDIATLARQILPEDGIEYLQNPNHVKLVVNQKNEAMYFSRSVIPFLRDVPVNDWLSQHSFYKHLGVYAYRAHVLQEITALTPSVLEKSESLEQLRWLENGYCIRVGFTDQETIGIDTPEDLLKAEKYIIQTGL